VKPGKPLEVIINEAENWPADLILVGAYGRSRVRNWQIGSVAESGQNMLNAPSKSSENQERLLAGPSGHARNEKGVSPWNCRGHCYSHDVEDRMENESPTSGIG
jgi:hypothetical protein